MTLKKLRNCLATLAIAMGCTAGHAAVVINNPPDQAFGTNMTFSLVADDFTLPGAYDITGLRFWSLQDSASDYSGTVYWAIYSDLPGGPGAVLHSGTATPAAVSTGASSGFGYDEYVFDIAVNFNLAAGTYWLALQDTALGNTNSAEMLWGTSAASGATGQYIDFTNNLGWVDTLNYHAFQISGDRTQPPVPTPEPATLVLLAGGLLASRLVRRQRATA